MHSTEYLYVASDLACQRWAVRECKPINHILHARPSQGLSWLSLPQERCCCCCSCEDSECALYEALCCQREGHGCRRSSPAALGSGMGRQAPGSQQGHSNCCVSSVFSGVLEGSSRQPLAGSVGCLLGPACQSLGQFAGAVGLQAERCYRTCGLQFS